jgi:spore coat polysaccharide biosynthesis predicted glycosyltransferase SpsG
MAGGSSIYEACVHGIPMVVISIAENQVLHSQAWQQLGCLTYLGPISLVQSSILSNSVYAISINESVRRKMSIACSKAVTGKGAKLVASLLSHEHRK